MTDHVHSWLASQPHGSAVIVLVCQVCGLEETRLVSPPIKKGVVSWIRELRRYSLS